MSEQFPSINLFSFAIVFFTLAALRHLLQKFLYEICISLCIFTHSRPKMNYKKKKVKYVKKTGIFY